MSTGDLQSRVRFAAPPTDDEHEPRAASGTAHAHYDRPASENERQQQHTSTHNQPRTQTYHHSLNAAALAAIAPKHAAQHPAGVSAAAQSTQQHTGRATQQHTLPHFFRTANAGALPSATTSRLGSTDPISASVRQKRTGKRGGHGVSKSKSAGPAGGRSTTTLSLARTATGAGNRANTRNDGTMTTTLPSRVRSLLSGVQPVRAQHILLMMAGAQARSPKIRFRRQSSIKCRWTTTRRWSALS